MKQLKHIACTIGAMLGIILCIVAFFGLILGIVYLCDKIHLSKTVTTVGAMTFLLAAALALIMGVVKWYKDMSKEVGRWLDQRRWDRNHFDFKKGDHIQQKYYDQMNQPVKGEIWVVKKANPYRGWVIAVRGQDEPKKIYYPKYHDYKVVYRPSDYKTMATS